MITYEAILKSVIEKLKKVTGDTVQILVEDFTESIIRPSFKVSIESTVGKFNSELIERNAVCRIYYFAPNKDKYRLDNLKMQQKLEKIFFDKIEVEEGFFIYPNELEFETTDTVLVCSFDFELLEEFEKDNEENDEVMEVLEWH